MSLTYCDGAASSTAAPTASASDPGPAASAIFFVYVPSRVGWRLVCGAPPRGLIYGCFGCAWLSVQLIQGGGRSNHAQAFP